MTTENLTKQMMDLVKANLPGAVADEMQNFIAEAKENKAKIKKLENQIEYYEDMEKDFQKFKQDCIDLNKLSNDLAAERESLDQRELDLEKRERNINLEIAEINKTNAHYTLSKIETLVSKVFGHPNVTIHNTKSKSHDEYNQQGYRETLTDTDTETTTKTNGKE